MSTSIRLISGRLLDIFDRTKILAFSMLAIMLAGLLSPIILGFIIETFGLSPAFYVAAVVVALAGIRMFIIRPDLIPGRRL